jgi:hypothetical protein
MNARARSNSVLKRIIDLTGKGVSRWWRGKRWYNWLCYLLVIALAYGAYLLLERYLSSWR